MRLLEKSLKIFMWTLNHIFKIDNIILLINRVGIKMKYSNNWYRNQECENLRDWPKRNSSLMVLDLMGRVVCGTDHSKFLNVQLCEEIPQDDLVNQGASDLCRKAS